MNEYKKEMICVTVNRQKREIPVDAILYAQVMDKLCRIRLLQDETIEIFLSISALMEMLPEDRFIRISRSCLVSLHHIQGISDSRLVLSNGELFSFSLRKKDDLMYAHRRYMTDQLRDSDVFSIHAHLASKYRCFDRCPFPFLILELNTEGSSLASSHSSRLTNFYVRYVNQAMTALVPLTPGQFLDPSIFFSRPENHRNIFGELRKIAQRGGTVEWFEKNPLSEDTPMIHVSCYQPRKGYCALLLIFTRGGVNEYLMMLIFAGEHVTDAILCLFWKPGRRLGNFISDLHIFHSQTFHRSHCCHAVSVWF